MQTERTLLAVALALLASWVLGVSAQSSPPLMKAIRVHEYGGVEVLKYEDAPRAEPKDEEVLIRVIAAGVNPVDAKLRSGAFKSMMPVEMPWTPGLDVSGVVEKAGAKATKFKKGDAVFACLNIKNHGGYAEYVVANEAQLCAKPKDLSYEGAAALPVAGSTAWQALVEIAKLGPGQTVLIHGGSGGVGMFAIQIAKARGAKVIATASAANQSFLKEMRADQAIDYKAAKFEETATDVDVVLDTVGGDTLKRSYGVVKKGGTIVSVVQQPDPAELKAREIRGQVFLVSSSGLMLGELAKLIEEKKLKPIVTKVFPLAEAGKAQEAIETGHTRGKLVLKVAEESAAK